MKVKELIALLELRDPEAIVRVADPDWEYCDGSMKEDISLDQIDLTKSYGAVVVDIL